MAIMYTKKTVYMVAAMGFLMILASLLFAMLMSSIPRDHSKPLPSQIKGVQSKHWNP
jgi:hypothetical protein